MNSWTTPRTNCHAKTSGSFSTAVTDRGGGGSAGGAVRLNSLQPSLSVHPAQMMMMPRPLPGTPPGGEGGQRPGPGKKRVVAPRRRNRLCPVNESKGRSERNEGLCWLWASQAKHPPGGKMRLDFPGLRVSPHNSEFLSLIFIAIDLLSNILNKYYPSIYSIQKLPGEARLD